MLSPASRRVFLIFLVVAVALSASFAQTRSARQKPELPKPPATQPDKVPDVTQDIETLKTDTDLVAVPVVASDDAGTYITDLRKEEFSIQEDGVVQQIAFFGKVAAP